MKLKDVLIKILADKRQASDTLADVVLYAELNISQWYRGADISNELLCLRKDVDCMLKSDNGTIRNMREVPFREVVNSYDM